MTRHEQGPGKHGEGRRQPRPDDVANDHGIGDVARRHAEADYAERFGTGHRTQNLPQDFGTSRVPQPFDRDFRREPGGNWVERYGSEDVLSALSPRGFRGRGPKNYVRSDERIAEDLNERLWYADDVDASDVSVEVKDGVVTLSGNVERRPMKHRIEDIADACGGVKDIRNEIRVQPRDR